MVIDLRCQLKPGPVAWIEQGTFSAYVLLAAVDACQAVVAAVLVTLCAYAQFCRVVGQSLQPHPLALHIAVIHIVVGAWVQRGGGPQAVAQGQPVIADVVRGRHAGGKRCLQYRCRATDVVLNVLPHARRHLFEHVV
ncbi:hypothetical protein D3C72_1978060 [compost metagenome]